MSSPGCFWPIINIEQIRNPFKHGQFDIDIGHIHNQCESNYVYLCFGKQRLAHWHYLNSATQLNHKLLTVWTNERKMQTFRFPCSPWDTLLQFNNNINYLQTAAHPKNQNCWDHNSWNSRGRWPTIFTWVFNFVRLMQPQKTIREMQRRHTRTTQFDNLLAETLQNANINAHCMGTGKFRCEMQSSALHRIASIGQERERKSQIEIQSQSQNAY